MKDLNFSKWGDITTRWTRHEIFCRINVCELRGCMYWLDSPLLLQQWQYTRARPWPVLLHHCSGHPAFPPTTRATHSTARIWNNQLTPHSIPDFLIVLSIISDINISKHEFIVTNMFNWFGQFIKVSSYSLMKHSSFQNIFVQYSSVNSANEYKTRRMWWCCTRSTRRQI